MITIYSREFNADVERFIKKNRTQFRYVLTDATNKMHKLAVNKAPVKDGKLKQNISQKVVDRNFTGEVESKMPYSEAVEKGTRPHHIRAKRKKVLAGNKRNAPAGFPTSKGWAIYGVKVQHPGTKPQPFLEPAWNVAQKWFMKKLKDLF